MSITIDPRQDTAQHRFGIPETTAPAPKRSGEGLPQTISADLGVPTVHRTVTDYANFDHGATTPALLQVADAVTKVQRRYGSVHRGAGYASRVTTGWFEAARAEVADFVGARADDQVVFTRNTTDALRLLAHCVPQDAQVFAWESAHHAAVLPWPGSRTTRLPVPTSTPHAAQLLREALQHSPSTTNLVVITGACNVTGEIWPVAELVAVAQEFGARTVLDAAQYAPHVALDIAALGVDWVAFSGHKLYAPYGAGVLAGRTDWLDAADPYLPAGGATARVHRDHTQWHRGPARHEGGTPNAVGAVAIAAACATLRSNRTTIAAHEAQLYARLHAGLAAIPGVRILAALGDRPNVGVVTFTVDGYEPSLVSQVLADEHAIAVRDGRFCAHLLCDAIAGDDATAIRASLGLATTGEHVDRLVSAVRRLVEHGPALSYVHTGDGWSAPADPRDLAEPLPW
ncbi:aminotransferase class V-fold PLP-dependent enzyme [Flexivirga oryzae]|uniref:Selenocysteine lyase/cysteine desulfurase n=1 Tax=Flexivirga oryzae TaxID=1794944 RepID=A0A839N711_9MICO|nr:aminotransferase class V-fold PLP-dependent enzyme [Flexivirga oryzae]MBB2890482.1 selenocysteine lyase/cysteine desulfurase [Flexivirga oryzae]